MNEVLTGPTRFKGANGRALTELVPRGLSPCLPQEQLVCLESGGTQPNCTFPFYGEFAFLCVPQHSLVLSCLFLFPQQQREEGCYLNVSMCGVAKT